MRGIKRIAAVLVALMVATGACGGESGGTKTNGDPSQVILVAARNTTESGSSKIAMTADFKSGETSFSMSGEGAFDYAKQAGRMTFKLIGDEIPEAFGGYDMIFAAGVVYMKFPDEFSQFLPGLKPWIKMDLDELAKQSELNLPGFNSLTNQDPTSALSFMRGAKNVSEKGRESIRGEVTTHYTMTIDLKEAVAAFPEESRAGLEDLIDKTGLTEIPMEAWIDGSDRVRRMRFSMDLSKLSEVTGGMEAGQSGVMTIGMDLFDFGLPVDVAAPPADQVSDYAELAKLGGGG